MVVSSAYKMHFVEFKAFGRSFMYKLNSKGPRIEPCGTPFKIIASEDVLEPTEV